MSLTVRTIGLFAVLLPLVAVGVLILELIGAASSTPEVRAAIAACFRGSLTLSAMATAIGAPIGMIAATYLAEWPRNPLRNVMDKALLHLGGIPSIIYGVFGAVIFSGLGLTHLSFALTLAFIVLPVAASATRDTLRRVPARVRRASIALGATRWAMLGRVVLPIALPGLVAGFLLSLARALAETTSLVAMGIITPQGDLAIPVLGAYAFRALVMQGAPGPAALALLCLFAPMAILHLAAAIADGRLPRENP